MAHFTEVNGVDYCLPIFGTYVHDDLLPLFGMCNHPFMEELMAKITALPNFVCATALSRRS